MKVIVDPVAADELEAQVDYLLAQGAPVAAAKLKARFDAFLEVFLATLPRTGRYVPERALWETWIPDTRLVVWYRFTDDELHIVRVWHTSRDRER
jgi:plasmid stabilization system protein ParE